MLIPAAVRLTAPGIVYPGEPVGVNIEFVAVIVAVIVGVEADGHPRVIDAEQLVHRRRGIVLGREVDLVETAVLGIKAEVGVDLVGVIGRRPEPDRDPVVVQPGDLRLNRAGEVLIDVVALSVRRQQLVALVRVALRPRTEVARDDELIVDAKQLVKGHVVVVVQRGEGIARAARRGADGQADGSGNGRTGGQAAGQHVSACRGGQRERRRAGHH